MKIGNICISNNLILAPMAGVTDFAFRSLAIESGADYGVGELVSAKALVYKNIKTLDLLVTAPNEKIKVVQLFGNDPEIMAKACKKKELQKFDIIDLNFGCPAPKVSKNGEGVALMKDIELARHIIRACVNATDKPITVKFRKGYDETCENYLEFAKMCEEEGVKAITLHARFGNQYYSGKADWDAIKKVKQVVNIPVIGNGDVYDKTSYYNMLNYTNCDAVMIGRGSMGKPYIFAELLDKKYNTNLLYYIKKHIDLLKTYYPDKFVVKYMRKHILWYLKGVNGSNKIKQKISVEQNLNNVLSLLEEVLT